MTKGTKDTEQVAGMNIKYTGGMDRYSNNVKLKESFESERLEKRRRYYYSQDDAPYKVYRILSDISHQRSQCDCCSTGTRPVNFRVVSPWTN